MHDRIRSESKIPSLGSPWKCRSIGAEITTKRATSLTQCSILTLSTSLLNMYRFRLRNVRTPCRNDFTIGIIFFYSLFEVFFNNIQRISRQKLPIRQFGQPILITSYARKSFYVIVPRLQIGVSNGPVNSEIITCWSFKIKV